MKNLLALLVLGLSIASFSFYELEGPYLIHKNQVGESNNLNHPIELLNIGSNLIDEQSWDINVNDYIFLYNDQTGYSVIFLSPWDKKASESGTVSFFQSKVSNLYCICESCCSNDCRCDRYHPEFYLVQENPSLNLSGFTEQLKGQSLLVNKDNKIFIKSPKIWLYDTYWSKLKVDIYAYEDGVKIYSVNQNDKTFSFEEALRNWFNRTDDIELDLIKNTVMSIINGATEKDLTKNELTKNTYELLNIVHQGLNKKAVDLLNNSKILAVYGVFEDDEGKNSIVWGLAEDIHNPEKRFHWITNLKDDISKLIPN